MGFRFLKRVRVVVSLFFLLLFVFLFVDFGNTLPASWISAILYFQFIPSLLKFLNLFTLLATGFIIVMILSLLFGRVYCSFLCPFGTLQDVIRFGAEKFKKRKIFRYSKPRNFLRYGFLALTILFLVFGSTFIVNLLDPYSNFGKIFSNLGRPVYYSANNVMAHILGMFDNYSLFKVGMKNYSWVSIGYSIFILGLITWMVHKHGRYYCNTVCPVGTALGILSCFSFFRIRLDESSCTSCGICGAQCKAECIDTKNKSVDFSRCVGCMNCLTSCPSNGVRFSLISNRKKELTVPADNRRKFIRNSALFAGGLFSLSRDSYAEGLSDGKTPVHKEFPVTPPGSLSIRHFTNSCTACHLCVSSCPTGVIQPSLFQYGIMGLMQPHMDYHTQFCNFECTVCSEVCPTGAIQPIALEEKKLTQLGVSKFIKENCVVYTDEKDCGACSEHCPTKSVNMVFYKDKLKIPEVDDKICIGCGACEHACPTTPKSIYVEGNPIHKPAEKPKVEKIETDISPEEDFPF